MKLPDWKTLAGVGLIGYVLLSSRKSEGTTTAAPVTASTTTSPLQVAVDEGPFVSVGMYLTPMPVVHGNPLMLSLALQPTVDQVQIYGAGFNQDGDPWQWQWIGSLDMRNRTEVTVEFNPLTVYSLNRRYIWIGVDLIRDGKTIYSGRPDQKRYFEALGEKIQVL